MDQIDECLSTHKFEHVLLNPEDEFFMSPIGSGSGEKIQVENQDFENQIYDNGELYDELNKL